MAEKHIITLDDLKVGEAFFYKELVKAKDRDNLFRAAVNCMLTKGNYYEQYSAVYDRMMRLGFETPEKLLERSRLIHEGTRGIRFPNDKSRQLIGLAKVMSATDLCDIIVADSKLELGAVIRKRVTKEWPGFGYKCASLFMHKCGYQEFAVLDIRVIRYLRSMDIDIEIPDFKGNSGLTDRQYLKIYEPIFQEMARGFNVTTGIFDKAVWLKMDRKNGEQVF